MTGSNFIECPSCHEISFEILEEKYAQVMSCQKCGLFKVKYYECCNNQFDEKVVYYQKDDRKTIREQCLNCGKLLRRPAISFSNVNLDILPVFNEYLADVRNEEFTSIRQEYDRLIKGNFDRIRYNKFESYYYTSAWRELRQKVFQRDNHKCVKCGNMASEVHHKHYINFRNESLEDLEAICTECHNNIHTHRR